MFFRPKTLDAIGYALPPPGPCPPTMETVRHGLRMHLESLRPAGAPPGCYRAAPGEPPSLAASCDAAILRWLMDDLSARAERKAWIEEIASQQDPRTGEWPGESRQVGTAVRALKVLRGKPRHPLCYLKVIEEPAAMEAWLDARDWSDPWAAAIEIQDAATPHIAGGTKGKEWLDRFFARLEAEQDPQTGFWTAGADASLEDGMAATFHIVPVYRAAGRSIPYKEAMLGSIFALRMPEGSFRSRCCQVDACHILQSLGAGDNRAREALRGVFEDLLRRWDAEAAIFRGASNLHELAAIYQVLLDTAPTAEDHRLARLTWRDAWDPALWEAPIR